MCALVTITVKTNLGSLRVPILRISAQRRIKKKRKQYFVLAKVSHIAQCSHNLRTCEGLLQGKEFPKRPKHRIVSSLKILMWRPHTSENGGFELKELGVPR